MDAWSRTGRSTAMALGEPSATVQTHDGLTVLPDTQTSSRESDQMLAPLVGVLPGKMLGQVFDGIANAYCRRTAYRVALDLEYPDYH